MDWVDLIILAVLLASVLGGMAQGFFRGACALLGLAFGILLASWNYARVAAVFKPIVRIETIADAIGFLLIALLVMAVAAVVGIVLKRAFAWMGLGCLDTLGGAFVGLLEGMLLVTLGIMVTVAFFPQAAWLSEARLPRMCFGALHLSAHMSPGELGEKLREGLATLEHDSRKLVNP
jgi:membrane protein required for colicin V production